MQVSRINPPFPSGLNFQNNLLPPPQTKALRRRGEEEGEEEEEEEEGWLEHVSRTVSPKFGGFFWR